MNCIDFKQKLNDYLDGTIAGIAEAGAMAKHRENCPDCGAYAAAELRLRRLLREMPVPAARPGFAREALQAARAHNVRPRRHGFLAGFGSAAAAALVVWLVALAPGHGPRSGVAEIVLAVEQPKAVNLVFNATADVANVQLEMELPSGFEFAGYEGERTLTWRTDIHKGRNVLTLPVVAHRPQQGVLMARLRFGNREKSLQVHLDAVSPRALQRDKRSSVA